MIELGCENKQVLNWFTAGRVQESKQETWNGVIEGLRYPLYIHQRTAIKNALPVLRESAGYAYLHQIGAGKSLTALATFLKLQPEVEAMIIVLPKSITGTMADQIELHLTKEYQLFIWDAVKAKNQSTKKSFDALLKTERLPIWIINVEAFQTKNEQLLLWWKQFTKKYKTLLVIDESHKIKTPNAARTKAITKLADDCAYKVIMTGSAVTNSPLDCYSQFYVINKTIWEDRNFFLFRNRYAILEKAYGAGGRSFDKVVGFKNLEKLQNVIAPFSHRVNREDLELSLPDTVDMVMHVELSDAQRKVYEELKRDMMSMVNDELVTLQNKISFFTKARQITGGVLKTENGLQVIDNMPPKLQALCDDVEGHEESAIIWCAFTADIAQVEKALREYGSVATFYGDTSDTDRAQAIHDFNAGKVRFFVASSAGSTGLNLQKNCRLQYWYGLFTSPENFEQAKGRTNRTGQSKQCIYKYLLARGTVDDTIYKTLQQKTDLMAQFSRLSMADIIEMM